MIKKHNNRIEIIMYAFLTGVLLAIGLDIYSNLLFFPIDNPSVLVAGQQGIRALVIQFIENPRTDFMYNIIIYLCAELFGNVPQVYYLFQFFSYVMTIVIMLFFCKITQTNYKASFAVICCLVCCTSIGENIYTIGKKEVLMTMGIALFVVCLYSIVFVCNNRYKTILCYVLYTCSIVFAMTLKETSIIIVGIFVLLEIYILLFDKKDLKKTIGCFIILFIVVVLLQIYKGMFINESTYTSYQISLEMIKNNIEYYFLYHKDVVLLGLLGLFSTMIYFFKDKKNTLKAFLLIINVSGWAFWGGLCLWRWPQSYYIYPIISFFAMSLSGTSLSWIKKNKLIKYSSISILILTFLYGVAYNYCVTSSHRDLGMAYSQCIQTLVSNVSDGERVILDFSNLYEEPSFQTKNLINQYYQRDIQIYGGRQNIYGEDVTDERLALYGYTREQYEEEKECAQLKVNDYLVHYINNRNYFGSTRAVNPAQTSEVDVYFEQNGYVVELISEMQIVRAGWNIVDGHFRIDSMQAGYQIWKIIDRKVYVEGLYADGWSGKSFTVNKYINGSHAKIHVLDIGSAINDFGSNSLTIYIDDQRVSDIEVTKGMYLELDDLLADKDQDKEYKLMFEVAKTFEPAKLQEGSNDTRELGVNIFIEQ